MSLFRREQRTASLASTMQAVGIAQRSAPAVPVTADTAMRLSTVWGCVRLIAETVAGLPVDVYRHTPDGARVEVTPAPAVVSSPSVLVSPITWRYQLISSLLLHGNTFGVVASRDRRMTATQIELVDPKQVLVRQDRAFAPASYWIAGAQVDPADIWHVSAHNLPGSVVGLSPIGHARATIGAGLAANEFSSEWWDGGGHPTGVLTSDQPIDRDTAEAMKARFKQATQGDKLAVLGAGLKYTSMQVSPKDSGWLDTIAATDQQICRFFGIPPEWLGIGVSGQNITYQNREQRVIDLLTFTVQWWLALIEEAWSALLPRGVYVKHNVNAILRADVKTRTDVAEKRIRLGLTNRNFERALEDLPPIEGGDEYVWPPMGGGQNTQEASADAP